MLSKPFSVLGLKCFRIRVGEECSSFLFLFKIAFGHYFLQTRAECEGETELAEHVSRRCPLPLFGRVSAPEKCVSISYDE